MPDPNDKEFIIRQVGRDEKGRPAANTRLTPSTDARECVVLCEPDKVIPVVFLPGIMGTNLREQNGGGSVWRPPNLDGVLPVLGALGTMIGFFFRGPATRQRRLNPDTTEIDDRGSIETEGAISREDARGRRWGTLMRSAYHPVMCMIQHQLNELMENCELLGEWRDGMLYRREPADYGEENGNGALSEEELKHAAQYRFEVWGGGYNWLQSSKGSADDIKEFIENVVLRHYREELGAGAVEKMKVILVTHSMGGFVARALTGIHGYDRVLGTVLGVMPATGAPATYKRMRSGFEGMGKVILGRNAAEVTAVMANSPGALELLPAADYGDGAAADDMAWLKLGGAAGGRQWTHALPRDGDPYRDIYKSHEWYGLVPAHNESLLDPAKSKAPTRKEEFGGEWSPRADFDLKVDAVKTFHDSIRLQYPLQTFAHYGDDSSRLSWSQVHWNGPALPTGDSARFQHQQDNGKGEVELEAAGVSLHLRIAAESGNGDGTVPTLSGMAPGHASVAASFRQGNQATGEHAGTGAKGQPRGYEHQDSYNDPRSRWATLYSIIKIAQGADSACVQ